MKKLNVNGNLLITGGLLVLSVAQTVLGNKKQEADMKNLKETITKEVMESLTSEKN